MQGLVEGLAFLLYVWEISGSNLDQDTGYCDWGSSYFFLVPPGNFWDGDTIATFRIFSNLLFINLIIRRHVVWATWQCL